MRIDELRDEGRRRATRLLGVLWRGLPITQSTRYKIQRLFPVATNELSRHAQPPPEYERPAPRARVAAARADERAVGYRACAGEAAVDAPRVVALHVTQPAWARVVAARPQFDGHAQPRLPGDLGFYDARDPAALARQVALAKRHGVGAFAFLDGPGGSALDSYLASPGLSLSFCMRWSHEDVAGDEERFLSRLTACLADPRALRTRAGAIVIVSRPDLLPDPRAATDRWRARCDTALVLCAQLPRGGHAPPGFDMLLEEPLGDVALAPLTARQTLINPAYHGEVLDWRQVAASTSRAHAFPFVSAGHDDEPLQPGHGRVYAHSSPRGYRDALSRALATKSELVFVDAWNDWARGAVLEPDARLGHAYLEATRAASSPAAPTVTPCAVVHVYYLELLDEILDALRAAGPVFRIIVTTPVEREAAVRARLAALGVHAEVEGHENRGRDILPFLRVANRLLDEGVEIVVKLHTKSSGHRTDGDTWRAELIGRLLEPRRVGPILAAFARDRTLGCVAPEGHVLPLPVYWGWNEENVRYLCVRMGIADPDLGRDRFAAGSMLWLRLSALRPLLDAHLGEWEFEPEGGYIDGTMPHAIERALGLAVQATGSSMRTAAEVCGLRFDPSTAYDYAEASGPAQP